MFLAISNDLGRCVQTSWTDIPVFPWQLTREGHSDGSDVQPELGSKHQAEGQGCVGVAWDVQSVGEETGCHRNTELITLWMHAHLTNN